MKNYLLNYIEENYKIIRVLIICILVGIIVGIIVYQFIDSEVRNQLIACIKETLDLAKTEQFTGINVLKNGIIFNIVVVFMIYLISITLIAPFGICGLNFIKGFSIGIYISTIFSIFGLGKGFLSILLIVVLPNIIYLPAYIYLSCNSIKFHYLILENNRKISLFIKEAYKVIIAVSLIILSIVIEQFASFGFIGLYV